MPANGPFTSHTDAVTAGSVIYDELSHAAINYGDPYTNTITWQNYRIKTTTTSYRYRICFLTKAAAESGITALQADFDAEGAALTPPRQVATVTAQIGYDGLAYDIIVNYANSVSVEEVIS